MYFSLISMLGLRIHSVDLTLFGVGGFNHLNLFEGNTLRTNATLNVRFMQAVRSPWMEEFPISNCLPHGLKPLFRFSVSGFWLGDVSMVESIHEFYKLHTTL